jgi:hypothetical protein
MGPDTGDLSSRIWLNSSSRPVTAEVLCGDGARFQSFGDTINTASQMDTTGMRGQIHLPPERASLLSTAGKIHWCTPRNDNIFTKGNDLSRMFWLDTHAMGRSEKEPSVMSTPFSCSSHLSAKRCNCP